MSSRSRPAKAALVAAAISLAGRFAYAECSGSALDLSWVRLSGAEDCPTAAQIRKEVEQRNGKPISAPGEGKTVEVVVERKNGQWTARIQIQGCGEDRTLRELVNDAPTCEPLARAAVIVIALAGDAGATKETPDGPVSAQSASKDVSPSAAPQSAAPQSATSAPKSAAPPPKSAASAPAQTKPQPPGATQEPLPKGPDRAFDTSITARALLTTGIVPNLAPGIALSAQWRISHWVSLTAGMMHLGEQPAANPTFAFGSTLGWIGACADVAHFSRVVAGPCLHIVGGSVHAVVHTHPTIIGTGPGQRAWVGSALGGRAGVRIVGPLYAELGAEAVLPWTRYAFVLRDDPSPVYLQPAVGSVFYLGVGVAFP